MIAGIKWSKSEKRIAKEVFERAYHRECDQIIDDIKTKAKKLKNHKDVWNLCDVLVKRRKEIDQKYDYRYSQLPFVFGLLLRDKLIDIRDLEGLGGDKLETIKKISNLDPNSSATLMT